MKMSLLGYRLLPTRNDEIGETALRAEPVMEQIFIKRPNPLRTLMPLSANYLC